MPDRPRPRNSEPEIRCDPLTEFRDPRHWQFSKRGNLYRMWEERPITIFNRYGGFSWCIAPNPINDCDELQFSKSTFETSADAIADVAFELGVK